MKNRKNIINAKKFTSLLMNLYNKGFFGPKVHTKFSPPEKAKTIKERLLYYFFSLSVDYGMKAESLFRRMRDFYNSSPEWFDPKFIRSQSIDEIVGKMIELKMRFPHQAAKRWKENAIRLSRFNDDIKKVFSGSTKEILENITSFYGFGPKLSRLLLRVVVDEGLIKPPEGFEEMELPTDVHVVKLAIRCGLIHGEIDEYNKYTREARMRWTELAKGMRILPADLDRALWVLGAEWCSKKKCIKCPLRKFCLLPANTS